MREGGWRVGEEGREYEDPLLDWSEEKVDVHQLARCVSQQQPQQRDGSGVLCHVPKIACKYLYEAKIRML